MVKHLLKTFVLSTYNMVISVYVRTKIKSVIHVWCVYPPVCAPCSPKCEVRGHSITASATQEGRCYRATVRLGIQKPCYSIYVPSVQLIIQQIVCDKARKKQTKILR